VINSTTVNTNRLIGSIIEQALFGNEEACTPKSIPMADSTLSSLHRHLNNFEWCSQIRLIVGFFHLINEADAIVKVTDTLTELRRHALTLQREGHCSDSGTRQSGMMSEWQNKHVNNNSNPHADNISRGLTHFLIAAVDAARRKEAISGW
jgi:hypothetical protein